MRARARARARTRCSPFLSSSGRLSSSDGLAVRAAGPAYAAFSASALAGTLSRRTAPGRLPRPPRRPAPKTSPLTVGCKPRARPRTELVSPRRREEASAVKPYSWSRRAAAAAASIGPEGALEEGACASREGKEKGKMKGHPRRGRDRGRPKKTARAPRPEPGRSAPTSAPQVHAPGDHPSGSGVCGERASAAVSRAGAEGRKASMRE